MAMGRPKAAWFGYGAARTARKLGQLALSSGTAVEQHRRFGRATRMVAADTGFYSLKNEKTIQGMGVTRDASRGAESQHQKQWAEKTAEIALVPRWAARADRMRRPASACGSGATD